MSFSFRDLIYGSQTVETQIEEVVSEESDNNEEEEIIYRPIGPVYSSLPKKRSLPIYSSFPELNSKKSRIFLPGEHSFHKFYQYERPPQGITREVVRLLWNQACFGGDIDAAVRILQTMIRIDSVEFSDFHQFLGMLRTYSVDSISNISLIAYCTIPMKIGPSKSTSAKYLLEMFVELFLTSSSFSSSTSTLSSTSTTISTESNESTNVIIKAIDFMNRFISNPLFSNEIHLICMLTGLNCLRGIDLCCSLVIENYQTTTITTTTTERYNQKKSKKYRRNFINALLEEKSKELIKNSTLKSICPTCEEICASPLLFAETIYTLKFYEIKYTKKFGPSRRDEVKRVIDEIGNQFDRTFRIVQQEQQKYFQQQQQQQQQLQEQEQEQHELNQKEKVELFELGVDFSLLYAGYLYGVGKKKEAMSLLKQPHIKNTRRGSFAYLQFLTTKTPTKKKEILTSAISWIFPLNPSLQQQREQNIHQYLNLPEKDLLWSLPSYPPTLEELTCATLLYQLGGISDYQLLYLLANAIEITIPSSQFQLKKGEKRNFGNLNVIFVSSYSEVHLALWSNLANLLGPLHENKIGDVGSGLSVDSFFDQIQSEQLKVQHNLIASKQSQDKQTTIPIDTIRKQTFDDSFFRKKIISNCKYIDAYGADAFSIGNNDNTIPTNSLYEEEKQSQHSQPELSDFLRKERNWWLTSGQIFSTHFIGEELVWYILECVAEEILLQSLSTHSSINDTIDNNNSTLSFDEKVLSMTQLTVNYYSTPSQQLTQTNKEIMKNDEEEDNDDEALSDNSSNISFEGSQGHESEESDAWDDLVDDTFKIQSSDSDNENVENVEIGGMKTTTTTQQLTNESGEEETEWKNFLFWCQTMKLSPSSSSPSLSSIITTLEPFEIKKCSLDLSRIFPCWKILSPPFVQSLNHSIGYEDRRCYFELGEGIMKILTYQILVASHFKTTHLSLFLCESVQLLFLQSNMKMVMTCLSYLTSMGVNVIEIVRLGNTLCGLGVENCVSSSHSVDVSLNEEILISSSLQSYRPM